MGTVFIISASAVTIIAVSGAPTRWVVGFTSPCSPWRISSSKIWSHQRISTQTFANLLLIQTPTRKERGLPITPSTDHSWIWWTGSELGYLMDHKQMADLSLSNRQTSSLLWLVSNWDFLEVDSSSSSLYLLS
jgi:hypothetical protein